MLRIARRLYFCDRVPAGVFLRPRVAPDGVWCVWFANCDGFQRSRLLPTWLSHKGFKVSEEGCGVKRWAPYCYVRRWVECSSQLYF